MKMHNTRRGIVSIWVGISIFALTIIVGLACDTAYVFMTAHQLQNAADAAALAGARHATTSPTYARSKAISIAGVNKAAGEYVQLATNDSNDANGDVVVGTWDKTTGFVATLEKPNAVKVLARRTTGSPGGALNLIFGRAFGVNTSDVSRPAIARKGISATAGLIVLNMHASPSLQLTGSGSGVKIDVNGGVIVVNSDSGSGVSWNGNPAIEGDGLYVGGNQSIPIFSGGSVTSNAPPIVDPYAELVPPDKGVSRVANTTNLQPGYYPGGISGAHTLAAGIYYVEGGISLSGNSKLDATTGVMIYLATGGISMGGNTGISINPPTTGTYAGISIFQARGNTSDISLRGTTGANNSGVLYFPSSHVSLQGNPTTAGSQLIADTVDVQGNASLTINAAGTSPILLGSKVYLVN